jgi:hypothetical protein
MENLKITSIKTGEITQQFVEITPPPIQPATTKIPVEAYVKRLIDQRDGLQAQIDSNVLQNGIDEINAKLAEIEGKDVDVVAVQEKLVVKQTNEVIK